MAHLNTLKIVGLVVLLTIALTLPTVLPEAGEVIDGQIQTQDTNLRAATTV